MLCEKEPFSEAEWSNVSIAMEDEHDCYEDFSEPPFWIDSEAITL